MGDADILCGDCGAAMVLRNSRFGKFFGCSRYPDCTGTHGAHPDGRPLGSPADLNTRKARIKAHNAFDHLWRSGSMSRGAAYHYLQQIMNKNEEEAHIAKFSEEECNQLLEKLKNHPAHLSLAEKLAKKEPS